MKGGSGMETIMSVTCPMCGHKISSDASFCPNCGMRKAGKFSKEYVEAVAESWRNKLIGKEWNVASAVNAPIMIKFSNIQTVLSGNQYVISADTYCPFCFDHKWAHKVTTQTVVYQAYIDDLADFPDLSLFWEHMKEHSEDIAEQSRKLEEQKKRKEAERSERVRREEERQERDRKFNAGCGWVIFIIFINFLIALIILILYLTGNIPPIIAWFNQFHW
jgi:hypothetical protein